MSYNLTYNRNNSQRQKFRLTMRNGTVICPALLVLVGCASSGGTLQSPLRTYDGPPASKSKIAYLMAPPDTLARLNILNGKLGPNRDGWGNPWDGSFYLEILAGATTLSVGYSYSEALLRNPGTYWVAKYSSKNDKVLTFDAKAGHIYELYVGGKLSNWYMLASIGSNKVLDAWVLDKSTNERVPEAVKVK